MSPFIATFTTFLPSRLLKDYDSLILLLNMVKDPLDWVSIKLKSKVLAMAFKGNSMVI